MNEKESSNKGSSSESSDSGNSRGDEWPTIMTLNPKLGGSCSGRTTTTLATLKGATGETRKLYVLLDNGSSNSILSDKYLFYVISVNKSKSH